MAPPTPPTSSGPSSAPAPDGAGVVVDVDGIRLGPEVEPDAVLHLHLDGRRVWSFRPGEAGQELRRGGRVVAWPRDLRRHLHGTAEVDVRDLAGDVLAGRELGFGTTAPDQRVQVVDGEGRLLVVDTSGRMVRTFETRGAEDLRPLIDALEVVIDALGRHGVAAFPAYGTLLGAVRGGRVIGHDNDADVGYLSGHDHPVDVIRESFGLQRLLHAEGFEITRYSGAGFKIVVGADRSGTAPIGLDVFAGFFRGDDLVLMGEISEPFERSWILPLGEVELEGRRFPAPAQPERLLTAMYGPSWRVPDPTFTFSTSAAVKTRLDTWFRGTRAYRNVWDRRYAGAATRGPADRDPHDLARRLTRAEAPGTAVLDVGCGRGLDAAFLGRRGHRVTGLDYSANGYEFMRGRCELHGWDVAFHPCNMLESRHVVSWAARAALQEGPRAVLARHFVDATTLRGRAGLWRLSRALLGSGGGRLYLEFMTIQQGRPDLEYEDGVVHDVDPAWIAWEVQQNGGTVLEQTDREVGGRELPARPVRGSHAPRACRMVVEWRP